jgi:RNA-directed DNA polymerase
MWLRSVVVEETGGGKPPKYSRPKQGTPQGGVISPLLANLYLHFFDVMFHKEYGPGTWARAKLVRYADDFVILSKHICERTKSFVEEALERRMGLRINRDKTAIRDLTQKGDNLEFLGYVFRREKAKQWKGWYDNLLPSKKALKTVRNKIKERTGPKVCFKPAKKVIAEVNAITRGWAQYFSIGYRAPAYHAVDNYVQLRLRKHLKRRSQRGYRRPAGTSWYSHLENLGMQRLSKRLAPVTAVR